MQPLTDHDYQLIQQAKDLIEEKFTVGKHKLLTILEDDQGNTITSVNLEGAFGSNDICAEQLALGQYSTLFTNQTHRITTIVTVRKPHPDDDNWTETKVVSPCGKCRDIIHDYAPQAEIVSKDEHGDLVKFTTAELLPLAYSKK